MLKTPVGETAAVHIINQSLQDKTAPNFGSCQDFRKHTYPLFSFTTQSYKE